MRLIIQIPCLNAIKLIANFVYKYCLDRCFLWILCALSIAFLLGGCSLPGKPSRTTQYDFGSGGQVLASDIGPTSSASLPSLRPLAIDDVTTSGVALDSMAVHYRLDYLDAQQLRAYTQSRWSMPPAQLVRQRLREQLSQRRAVFNARDGLALNRGKNAEMPLLLKLELLEFSQIFSTPTASFGLIRLRVTLAENTPTGEKLVAQRSVLVQRPALSADASGGVRALMAATDAAIQEIEQWLQQAPAR